MGVVDNVSTLNSNCEISWQSIWYTFLWPISSRLESVISWALLGQQNPPHLVMKSVWNTPWEKFLSSICMRSDTIFLQLYCKWFCLWWLNPNQEENQHTTIRRQEHGYKAMSILCAIWKFTRYYEVTIICQIITPAPGMKQVLDKPGSCGQYENYQRPEGFPVGKQSKM